MTDELLTHIIQIKERQASLFEKVENIEKAVGGNGQPGLMQKVEELQASKNRIWGAGTVLAVLAGAAEWFLHRH